MKSYEQLMVDAIQLRRRLGEDANSPIDIFAIAQSIDRLTIVYYPMGDNLSGMCIKSDRNNNIIAINSTMTVGRQRYSMAHEFYHLFLDENMSAVCAKAIGTGSDTEREADVFASYFLIPAAELLQKADEKKSRNEDHKLSIRDVISLEQYFGVSHQAMIIRLKQDRLMDPIDIESIRSVSVKRLASSIGYDTSLYSPLPVDKQYKTYGYYIDQVETLRERNLISSGKYEELLLTAFRSDIVYGDIEEGGELID